MFMAGHAAQAAQPNISDAIRQTRPPVMAPAPESLPPVDGIQPVPEMKAAAGEKIVVKKINITGNTVVDTSTLHDLVRDGEGRSLTLHDLEALAARITMTYRRLGYFVARAILPAQDVVDGVITIQVIEGRYNKLILKNTSRAKSPLLQGMLDKVKTGKPIKSASLERALLNVNAVPGVVVRQVDIAAGSKPGTSNFVVDVGSTRAVTGYAIADNYGSVYTGKKRLNVGMDFNSPTGHGDRLSWSGLVSNGQDLKNYRVGYGVPLGYDGLRAEAAISRTTYGLTDIFAPLKATGTANTAELNIYYPLRRTRASSIDAALNLNRKKLVDEVGATSTVTAKDAVSMTPAVTWTSKSDWFGLPGNNTVVASATLGHLDFRDAAARAIDKAGADTQGRYGHANLSVARIMQLAPKVTLTASARAQRALFNKNLDGSEDMSISGITGVKAYSIDEAAAENAYLGNAEIQYNLIERGQFSARVGLFADVGHTSMQKKVGAGSSRNLSDVGVGLYTNYGPVFTVMQVAMRTGSEGTSEPMNKAHGLLQIGVAF